MIWGFAIYLPSPHFPSKVMGAGRRLFWELIHHVAAIHQMTVHLLRLMNINFRLITRQTALITRPVRGRRLGDNSTSVRRDGKRKRTGSPEEDQGGGKMKGKEKEMSSDEEMDDDDLEEEEERNAKSKEKEKGEEVWETYERTKMMYDELPPEVSVAAAWVIVMKMLYGLDGQPRYVDYIFC